MTLIALSASYGAGGSRVGPALAECFGVPFLDRAIPVAVAERLEVPVDDAMANDETVGTTWLERLLSSFVALDTGSPTPVGAEALSGQEFRQATEAVIARQAASGHGVILGRGAAVLLRADPRVLRVRLDGPPEDRVRQAMVVKQVDEGTARQAVEQLDRAHADYLRHFYNADINDARLYHVVLDSTALGLDDCVELIAGVVAARGVAESGS
jgi:cytidylate kinase